MLQQLDLNEVAEAYLSARTPDRLEYERLLIRAQGKAVYPLLHALLAQVVKQKQAMQQLGQEFKTIVPETGLTQYLWLFWISGSGQTEQDRAVVNCHVFVAQSMH